MCKNRFLFAAIFGLFLLTCGDVSAAPVIKVVPGNYNFGSVVRGDVVAKEFSIQNQGSSQLDIALVKTSCGCSAVFLEGQTVMPGGTTRLNVEFDSSDFLGKVHKTVFIYSNDPQHPEYRLTFTATVASIITAQPDRLYLGTLKSLKETGKDFPFTVSLLSDQAGLTNMEFNHHLFNVACGSRQPQDNRYEYNCRLTVKPDIPVGSIKEELIIHTNIPEQPHFKMQIFGIFKDGYKVLPMLVDYAKLSSHQKAQKSVTIKRTDGKPFDILKVILDRKEMTYEIIPQNKGQAYQIILHFAPSGLAGVVAGQVVVLTDHDRHSEIQIKYQALVS